MEDTQQCGVSSHSCVPTWAPTTGCCRVKVLPQDFSPHAACSFLAVAPGEPGSFLPCGVGCVSNKHSPAWYRQYRNQHIQLRGYPLPATHGHSSGATGSRGSHSTCRKGNESQSDNSSFFKRTPGALCTSFVFTETLLGSCCC